MIGYGSLGIRNGYCSKRLEERRPQTADRPLRGRLSAANCRTASTTSTPVIGGTANGVKFALGRPGLRSTASDTVRSPRMPIEELDLNHLQYYDNWSQQGWAHVAKELGRQSTQKFLKKSLPSFFRFRAFDDLAVAWNNALEVQPLDRLCCLCKASWIFLAEGRDGGSVERGEGIEAADEERRDEAPGRLVLGRQVEEHVGLYEILCLLVVPNDVLGCCRVRASAGSAPQAPLFLSRCGSHLIGMSSHRNGLEFGLQLVI